MKRKKWFSNCLQFRRDKIVDNYFSRSCNPTSRKFFEDFDLLPKEAKELLWAMPQMPTFEDLKLAWDISAETFSIDKLKTALHIYEEERKAEKKRNADEERERKRRERANSYFDKYRKRTPLYEMVRREPRAKDMKLIERVSEEKAVTLLAQRKNGDDKPIAQPHWERRFIGYKEDIIAANPDVEIQYYEGDKLKHTLSKQMGNG